jgi:hypothetical protein
MLNSFLSKDLVDAIIIKNAFVFSYGYNSTVEIGGVTVANPISKEEFVKQKCIIPCIVAYDRFHTHDNIYKKVYYACNDVVYIVISYFIHLYTII